ncbi:MAG: patatin-like phospholipase family protein [Gammaproteobacteria bacterium]
MNRCAFAVLFLAFLSGCASNRPMGISCLEELDENGRLKYVDPWSSTSSFNLFLPNAGVLATENGKRRLNVLALSAGGQFGAYGAAFLHGWEDASKNLPEGGNGTFKRNEIDVVTGVSTGAVLSTHAFVAKDAEIEQLYRDTSAKDIYEQRSFLSLLFANSLMRTAKKDKLLEDNIDDDLIKEVAAQAGDRQLVVGVVDVDTGEFLRVNMVKLAKHGRYECYRAVVGASAAVPIVFEPKFFQRNVRVWDKKTKKWDWQYRKSSMLVDGGVRTVLFIDNFETSLMQAVPTRRLFSIVHGELGVEDVEDKDRPTPNGLLGIAGGVIRVVVDEHVKGSVFRLHYVATQANPGAAFETYYADASEAACRCAEIREQKCQSTFGVLDQDLFCKEFMNCLADRGYEDGIAYAVDSGKWVKEPRYLKIDSRPIACGTRPPDPLSDRPR